MYQDQFNKITCKCILLGDGNVGKTSLINRLMADDTTKKYDAAMGVVINTIDLHTSRGPIRFEVWDTAGQEKSGNLPNSYYEEANCAIILFDVSSAESYDNIYTWHNNILRLSGCTDIPIALCGNKVDLEDRKIYVNSVEIYKATRMKYFNISVKQYQNYVLPFLWLCRKLFGDANLEFIETLALPPPVLSISDQLDLETFLIRQKEALNERLPDDNEEGL